MTTCNKTKKSSYYRTNSIGLELSTTCNKTMISSYYRTNSISKPILFVLEELDINVLLQVVITVCPGRA
jgi:hypothetical protein